MPSNRPDQSGYSNQPARHDQQRESSPQRRPQPQAPGREDHEGDRNTGAQKRRGYDKQRGLHTGPIAAETGKIQSNPETRNMQVFRALPILALAAALGLGMTANAALAPQMSSSSDHSSSTGQSISEEWITTKVKSELTTTKGGKSMDVKVRTTDGW